MKRKLLLGSGLLLITAALCLLHHNFRISREAQASSAQILQELTRTTADREAPQPPSAGAQREAEASQPENQPPPMPEVWIDGRAYIGRLAIPALELELPVISRWDEASMNLAPCRYAGSAYADNLIICGHNYAGHFRHLKDLEPGEEIILIDGADTSSSYSVRSLEILSAWDTEEMLAGDWDLTLFTCTIGGLNRMTVRCDRTETP